MPTEEQKKQSEQLWRAWALWAFWTSDECLQFLRLLNPQASWSDLRLSFLLFASLPEEQSLDLYSRLHGRGGVEACRLPNILHDLSYELEKRVALDEEWRGRLQFSC
jgi:hypothetical protein